MTSTWSGIGLVARREFVERVRERSFLISTAVSAVILVALILLPRLLSGSSSVHVVFAGSDAAAVAAAAQRQAAQAGVDLVVVPSGSASEDERRARAGEVDALVDGDTVVSKSALDPNLLALLNSAHQQVVGAQALADQGIDPARVTAALTVPPLRAETATPSDPKTDQRRTVAFVATIILYGQIVGYGFWVATGVVEEKASRVVEVLLATVRPKVLLSGKIIGIGLLGLLQLLGLGVVALAVGTLSGALDITGDATGVLVLVAAWFLLGYSFYAAVFAATAARVSRQEEVQNVTTPVTMLLLLSFFGGIYASNEPGTTATAVLSVVPPFSALVSPPRVAAGVVPLWQGVLSVALMLLAVLLLVRVAGRLYEGSVLRTGARVSLREAWRRTSAER
jgi:ABC-2 type transport system permease protein